MGKYLGPKHKLCHKEGIHLGIKGKKCEQGKCSLSKRKNLSHVKKHKKFKVSNYSVELREKQKIKRIYGIRERQFYNTFLKASKISSGITSHNLLFLLEKRLDTLLVRSHFASSQYQARQLINHGHILVNNKKVNIASYQVSIGDVVELKSKSKNMSIIRDNLNFFPSEKIPSWLEVNQNNLTCKILSEPSRDSIKFQINEHFIVEFYSKK